ncbi:unnamed protein product [Rotaria magnacalcarata]|uniref:NADP-dependent oxidoreductase domain-containing protein n=1 Tax=Rotaria magnacalcarata TaxID=392030 RepID=A0A820DZE0_9BILA|nr:unnamed protein product [Rotaria magnacalcarata]CAF4172383.1 unnamed protein product [Rotaria magnacalcarata]CAF4240082.1 unnamed protein product [Rotaria magnacalcarata]
MSSLESILMNNNVEIPQLAFGTYDIINEEIVNVIESGLSIGLSNQFKKGKIKRSDLFLTSKLWCSFHKFERVRQQCLITINDLQYQYLDLFLIHWPFAFVDQDPERKNAEFQSNVDDKLDFLVTWKAMEMLVDEGLVKSIGLSNFNEEQIERIIQICKYKPVVNQVEIHPYCPQIQLEIFCKKHQILLGAYTPLGAETRQWKKENDPEILEDKTIKLIADKYNVHPASVLLRYIIDQNLVCIVKSANHKRIKQNFHSINENQFKLDQEDFNKIHNDIQIRFRYHQLQERRHAKEYPFKH